MRCDRCGKFRKDSDVVMSDHGDQFGNFDYVTECKWCMSPADRERYGLTAGQEGEERVDELRRGVRDVFYF